MKLKSIQRGLFVMATGLAVAFYVAPGKVNSQVAQQGEKTIEQTHKDIKVLQGQPDSQLSPIMNYFSAALGVNCAFCHVREGERMAFDKEHEHKTIAREMVKLVQDINKNNFGGKNEVSCFTCHQGRPMPTATPTLPLPAPINFGGPRPPAAPGAPGATPPPPPAPTVTAEQVWDQYVQAVGGKETIAKLKNRTVKGTFTGGNNMTSEFEVAIDGGKISVRQKNGTMESANAFDGNVGWVKDARGQRDMNVNDVATAKALLEMFDAVKFMADPAEKLQMGRKTKIGDREVNVIRTTRNKKRVTLFFDATTGLLVRKQELTPMYLGNIPEQIDYEDYRDVDGVKIPTTIRFSSIYGQTTGVRKLTEVKHNVTIDEALFAAPAK